MDEETAKRLEKLIPDAPSLAEFSLLSRLGEGGAAEVWRAWDRSLRRWVAIKIPQSRAGWERFEREAQAAARLNHPNIVPIYRIAEDQGKPYIVMRLVEGKSLADEKPPLRRAVEVVRTAALAVHHAHEQGVVHRDLKPGNLMLDEEGVVWVLDFGLAYLAEAKRELTTSGAVMGTRGFMSPEQERGAPESRNATTDVYSLGATLAHLAPGMPRDLRTIVEHAMEEEPGRRYPTAAALAEDLGRWLADEPILARPRSRLLRSIRRNPALWALPFFVLLMVGATVILVRQSRERMRQESLEQIRVVARMQLETALTLRRKGQPELMRDALPPLQKSYDLASQRHPRLAEIDYLMGRFHRGLMDVDEALRYQNQALEKDPNYAPARYERAVLHSRKRYRLLQILYSQGMPESQEVESLRKWIVEDCRGLDGAAQGILAMVEGRYEEAERILRAAVDADPLSEEAWEAWANLASMRAWHQNGDWIEVDRICTEALRHDAGHIPVRVLRGMSRWIRAKAGKEEFARAREDFDEILRMKPKHLEALLWRGSIHGERQDWKSSEADYEAVLAIDPKSPRALWGRGVARLHQEKFDGAIEDLSDFLAQEPMHAEARRNRGMARLARGQRRQKENRDPLSDYAAAEEDLSGGDAESLALRGDVHWSRGSYWHSFSRDSAKREYAAAAADYAEAMRLKPELQARLEERYKTMVEYSK